MADFARAFFESMLEIGSNIWNGVARLRCGRISGGRLVGGRWVGRCWIIHCQSDFLRRSASGRRIWRLGRVFGRRRGAIGSLSFENTRTRHCRVVVVVLVAMAVRTKFSRFVLMGFC